MALEMTQQQSVATVAQASTQQQTPHDHASHDTAVQAEPGHTHASTQASHDCLGHCCTSCPVCHSAAMTLLPQVPALTEAPRQAPLFRSATFASAERASGFKPPIS